MSERAYVEVTTRAGDVEMLLFVDEIADVCENQVEGSDIHRKNGDLLEVNESYTQIKWMIDNPS